jgi:predicted amino acid dehydrogenase
VPEEAALPRFAFLVHALSALHRGAMGVRQGRLGLILQQRDGSAVEDITPLCHLSLAGVAEGVVIGIPMTPEQMLADQELALSRMEAAVASLDGVAAVGLGSLCAVVAGRGEALSERVGVPITTGAAATAWALSENTLALKPEGLVGIIGSRGPVGGAVAEILSAAGVSVLVDSRRTGRALRVPHADSPEALAEVCDVLVGAGPTGASLESAALRPGMTVVDVAIPATIKGRAVGGVRVLSGEAVTPPPGWTRGFWGSAYHLLAGYGLSQVYACLLEPLVMAAVGQTEPLALGRQVSVEAVRRFGASASELGFVPCHVSDHGLSRWM